MPTDHILDYKSRTSSGRARFGWRRLLWIVQRDAVFALLAILIMICLFLLGVFVLYASEVNDY